MTTGWWIENGKRWGTSKTYFKKKYLFFFLKYICILRKIHSGDGLFVPLPVLVPALTKMKDIYSSTEFTQNLYGNFIMNIISVPLIESEILSKIKIFSPSSSPVVQLAHLEFLKEFSRGYQGGVKISRLYFRESFEKS